MSDIRFILNKVTDTLRNVSGIQAIVLGGSRASGTHSKDSDIDIGIYYDDTQLDVQELNKAAQELDDNHRDHLMAPPGEWGNWVNGGAWLIVDGMHVDFLLRDVERVEHVIQECFEGKVYPNYQTGHPHAYINVMYAGELAISKLLWKKTERINELKNMAESYPINMKQALIQFFMFEADFSCMFAENHAEKDDRYYVMAHIVRSVSCLNQVIFAINERYCVNEKKAVKMIDTLNHKPNKYRRRIDHIFLQKEDSLKGACENLRSLIEETKELIKESA